MLVLPFDSCYNYGLEYKLLPPPTISSSERSQSPTNSCESYFACSLVLGGKDGVNKSAVAAAVTLSGKKPPNKFPRPSSAEGSSFHHWQLSEQPCSQRTTCPW
jgi:hypothetical protein